eukprot:m.8395 g.8395  ORF g.8395 m.8395 type:complete len:391 (-) comp5352_c0_seq1:184-1356(-)
MAAQQQTGSLLVGGHLDSLAAVAQEDTGHTVLSKGKLQLYGKDEEVEFVELSFDRAVMFGGALHTLVTSILTSSRGQVSTVSVHTDIALCLLKLLMNYLWSIPSTTGTLRLDDLMQSEDVAAYLSENKALLVELAHTCHRFELWVCRDQCLYELGLRLKPLQQASLRDTALVQELLREQFSLPNTCFMDEEFDAGIVPTESIALPQDTRSRLKAIEQGYKAGSLQCAKCNITFGYIQAKRHHCRLCGQAFCDADCHTMVELPPLYVERVEAVFGISTASKAVTSLRKWWWGVPQAVARCCGTCAQHYQLKSDDVVAIFGMLRLDLNVIDMLRVHGPFVWKIACQVLERRRGRELPPISRIRVLRSSHPQLVDPTLVNLEGPPPTRPLPRS